MKEGGVEAFKVAKKYSDLAAIQKIIKNSANSQKHKDIFKLLLFTVFLKGKHYSIELAGQSE